MNLRRKKPHDSLYMLLDTMCNAFGGIILLAVLVVLLTNQEKASKGAASDRQEMLERRLGLAWTNLEQSMRLATTLQEKANDPSRKQQVALVSTRTQLQSQVQQIRLAIDQGQKEIDSANAADPAQRLKFLNGELATAQTKKLDVQNALTAVQENIKRSKQRSADMGRLIAAKRNDLERPLRLPKEHETGKRVVYLIARYGRIYPCRNSDLSRNETDIIWTSGISDLTAEPIPGRGINPITNPATLEAYFASQSRESVYMAFCVFEDSFPAFIHAKEIAMAKGLSFGWDPFKNEDGPVTFSENGHRPKPQ